MSFEQLMCLVRAKFRALGNTGFVRSVAILIGGTAFAQAIGVLVLPFITRLYTPADFNTLAVFSSILSIISVAACLRLEIAIPLPEADEDAANLLALALCASSIVAAFVALSVYIFPTQISELLTSPALQPYLWLVPVGIWVASAYAAVQFWATRKKRFAEIAKTRMTQALGGAAVQVGLGWAGVAPLGLLLGQIFNSGAALFGLSRSLLRQDKSSMRSVSWHGMVQALKNFQRFPKYSTFEALFNSAGIPLAVSVIAAMTVGPEAGYLLLATRAMGAPVGLLAGAIAQVYLSRAPDELRAGRLPIFTLQIVTGLAKSGVGPLVFAGMVAPLVFPVVFGEVWLRAGEMVAWMTPWFVMQLLASPISMTLHVTGNQGAALGLQLFGLVLRVGSVLLSKLWFPSYLVETYLVSGFFFYLVYFFLVIRLADVRAKDLSKALTAATPLILIWSMLGLVVLTVFKN